MNLYKVDQWYEFDVLPDTPTSDHFKLRLADRRYATLKKLKFQLSAPLPQTIRCRVKGFDRFGLPTLTHDIARYVYDLYHTKDFSINSDFEFTVAQLPAHRGDPFSVVDKYGIYSRLYDPDAILEVGQKVMCSFNEITPTRYSLRRSDSELSLQFLSLRAILDTIGINRHMRRFIETTMMDRPVFAAAADQLQNGNARWILTMLATVGEHIDEWFTGGIVQRRNLCTRMLLNAYREAALMLIENSRFLRDLSPSQRGALQSKLTATVDSIEPYNITLNLLINGSGNEFIENLMFKLRRSGYLYHPTLQLSVLMLLLRIHPDHYREGLGHIFEVIMDWDISTWRAEPFRSAFIEQFEIFIDRTRRRIDMLPMAESEAENDRIVKMITAIALQQAIAGNDDFRRNRSLFYRYISLLRPDKATDLLDKSFLTLMGVKFPVEYDYEQIKEPMMLMTLSSVGRGSNYDLVTTHTLRRGTVEISVNNDGIALRRADDPACDQPAIPAGMLSWLSPQIFIDGIKPPSSAKIRNFDEHRRMWKDIECALFEHTSTKVVNPDKPLRVSPDPGDTVGVIIERCEPNGKNPRLLCRICDDHYNTERAYIMRDDIVGYNVNFIPADAYRAPDGRPYHFFARVIAQEADGSYHLTLRDEVNEYLSASLDTDYEYTGVIAGHTEGQYSIISNAGFGCLLDAGEYDGLPNATIVRFRVTDTSNPAKIKGIVSGLAPEGETVDKKSAIKAILAAIAYEPDDENTDDDVANLDAPMRDEDEELTETDLREIIELMRFKAISSVDALEAFDYLMFSRLLAIATNDDTLAQRLATHASLLNQLQFYAANGRINTDALATYADMVKTDPLIAMMYKRLEIVSWLGDSSHNKDLWATVNNPANKLEGTLASTVLSFNMLSAESATNDSSIAKSIKTAIASLLNVNADTRALKYYGSESLFVEFKSSLVYPARKRPSDPIQPDPDAQQREILEIIAGMLNASGGRLYIGVNNQGYEAGFHDDFAYYTRRKAGIGIHRYEMKTLDNIAVFLENLVEHTFGSRVKHLVDIAPDTDSAKGVIVVKIKPSLTPVTLGDNILFVRSSTSNKPVFGDERAEFEAERRLMQYRHRAELEEAARVLAADDSRAAAVAAVAPSAAADSQATPPAEDTDATSATTDTADATETAAGIALSRWRQNVLHEFEDGYAAPTGYLYISTGNHIEFSVSDQWKEKEPDILAAIAIAEHERSSYLILAYDRERAVKIPLAEIYEKGENRISDLFQDGKLVFATIAGEDDAILSIHTDAGGGLWQRMTPVSDIDSGHLSSTPSRLLSLSVADTVAYELVPQSRREALSPSAKNNLNTRQIGFKLRFRIDTADYAARLAEAIDICRPHR